jgi:hypothetical protein
VQGARATRARWGREMPYGETLTKQIPIPPSHRGVIPLLLLALSRSGRCSHWRQPTNSVGSSHDYTRPKWATRSIPPLVGSRTEVLGSLPSVGMCPVTIKRIA